MKRVTTTQTAVERASAVWRCTALVSRHELRERGVRGPLRRLTDLASTTRGTGAPRGIAAIAIELHEAGEPLERIIERMRDTAELMVRAVCEAREPQQTGGPKSA